jgi:hypothetical protein
VKEIHGCASGLERETPIGSVTSRLAQPVGEAIAAHCPKRRMRDEEGERANLPIDPQRSPQVTVQKRGVERPFAAS